MKRLAAAALLIVLAGCAAHRPAPVVDRMQPPPAPIVPPPAPTPPPAPAEKPVPTYVVKKGDTLVSIALANGLDYRDLAAWNNIPNVNRIEIGQALVLAAPTGAAPPASTMPPAAPVITPLAQAGPPIEARPLSNTATAKVEPRATKVPFSERALTQLGAEAGASALAPDAPPPMVQPPAPAEPAPPVAPPPVAPPKAAGTDKEDVDWMWPAKGKVLAPFTEASKGMDIGGRKGAPVVAAASGRVVYAGVGLRGYGQLVIIKHNETWLSAYAHNDKILVKEQQDVKKGQKIAEMGATDADQVKLHFEVRRQGKPVDPAKFLPPM
ncbi:MAG TPA: peptidoglycan DD-metalloendopeptidase family protein [Usitatibacter sp.]|jgi:lipoprotein NlpD|nr:peptidoglycan DD-metalloendopeptidase family protein [Usitatibacter sp.]